MLSGKHHPQPYRPEQVEQLRPAEQKGVVVDVDVVLVTTVVVVVPPFGVVAQIGTAEDSNTVSQHVGP